MSQHPVIRFHHVGKRFRLNRRPRTVWGRLRAALRPSRDDADAFWAVRDVSFDVPRGESIGLIGRNGSGKSTLLKLATRILRPTIGRVQVNGRIGALLELGAGFHDDLTGRENIYLNGSVLGLSRREIDGRLNQIVDFSELHDFIDVPVKFYSSGMYMRLGFSVAVHCDPELLLVDEILAVGDQAFQAKCIDRIYELKRSGVTIVMVSHHAETLQKLCSRLVWMDRGALREIGPTAEVLGSYVAFMQSAVADQTAEPLFHRAGTREAEITGVRFLNAAGAETEMFRTGEALTIEMAYVAHRPIDRPELGFGIFREDGVQINGTSNRHWDYPIPVIHGPGLLRYHIPNLPLMPGGYAVSAAIQDADRPLIYDFHVRAYHFRVEPGGVRQMDGLLALPAEWEWLPAVEPAGAPTR